MVSDRFWSKVQKTEECWVWIAGKSRGGYGKFSIGKSTLQAHRYSWSETNGPIPDGLDVLHKCDNPPCVRPEHLFLGTHSTNMKDRAAKGRQPRGTAHSQVKLTESEVIEIRNTLPGHEQAVADRFGISRTTVYDIRSRRSWRHVK